MVLVCKNKHFHEILTNFAGQKTVFMAQKPSIPKGTRDFGQEEMARRNYIFDTIRSVFLRFGYHEIETPAMETSPPCLESTGTKAINSCSAS